MSKTKLILLSSLVGLLAAVGRVVYLNVATSGMSEYALTVTYGASWSSYLPVTVIGSFLLGFSLLPALKSFTAKI